MNERGFPPNRMSIYPGGHGRLEPDCVAVRNRSGRERCRRRRGKSIQVYGLSSETWGRLCVLVTSKSTSSAATGFDRMLVP